MVQHRDPYSEGTFVRRYPAGSRWRAAQAVALTLSLFAAALLMPGSALSPLAAQAGSTGQHWFYKSNTFGGYADSACFFGDPGDPVVAGDWNGDGQGSVGVFRSGAWALTDTCGGNGEYHFNFGVAGDVPVVGDWNGDGIDTPGIYRSGQWYLSNSFSGNVAHQTSYGGLQVDRPVVGDWDGDGDDTIGIFRSGTFHLSNTLGSPTAITIPFGDPADVPVVGDWDGDGDTNVGIVRGNHWALTDGLAQTYDRVFRYGDPGDRPLIGDWDADGAETPAVVRNDDGSYGEGSSHWALNNGFSGTNGDTWCHFGPADGQRPVVGDWYGTGRTSLGVVTSAGRWRVSWACSDAGDFWDLGTGGDIPVAGDWNGDGIDTPGYFRNGWFYLSNDFAGTINYAFAFGSPGDIPVVGNWDGLGGDSIGVRRNNMFYLSDTLNSAPSSYQVLYGDPYDEPVIGDWDGDGDDSLGVHRGNMWALSNGLSDTIDLQFMYGDPTDTGVVGDWDGDGKDTPAVVRMPTPAPDDYLDDEDESYGGSHDIGDDSGLEVLPSGRDGGHSSILGSAPSPGLDEPAPEESIELVPCGVVADETGSLVEEPVECAPPSPTAKFEGESPFVESAEVLQVPDPGTQSLQSSTISNPANCWPDDTELVWGKWYSNRYSACQISPRSLTVLINGKPSGAIWFQYVQSVALGKLNTAVTTRSQMLWQSCAQAGCGLPFTFDMTIRCEDDCGEDKVVNSGTVASGNPGALVERNFYPSVAKNTQRSLTIDGRTVGHVAPGYYYVTDPRWEYHGSPWIRCDDYSYFSQGAGCVFRDKQTRWSPSASDPFIGEAIRHVRDAQRDKYAWGTAAAPLSRGVWEAMRLNRGVACEGKPASDGTVLPPHGSGSCDEFPMAATAQGCYYYPGRCSRRGIDKSHNQRAGTAFNNFMRSVRLVRGGPDTFLIRVKP